MKIRHLLIFILFICSCNKNKSSTSKTFQDDVSIYSSKIKDQRISNGKKIIYNNKIFDILLHQKNSLSSRNYLYECVNSFYNLDQKNSFKRANQLLLSNSKKANDTINLSNALRNFGKFYINEGQNDSSFYYYLKAEKISYNLKDNSVLGDIYLDKAFIQLYESDFYGSEVSASKALSYLIKQENKFKIYDAYNLIGICSNQLKNYDKALEYHYKALSCYKENNLKSVYHVNANSLNNIGYVYQNMNNHKKAILNFNLALSDKTLYKDNPNLYAMLLDNLAYSKFKLRDYSNLPYLFFKSLKIRDSLKTDFSGIILNKIHLSELFYAQEDTLKAQLMAKEALEFARKTKVASDILISLQQLSAVERENAVIYSKEYIKISDSLQQAERIVKDKFARIAYETEEISLEKDKLEEQNRNLLYFFIGSLMIGLLLFVIRTQRAKNRELLLKQAQQKANEDIYNLMIAQQSNIEEGRIKEKKRIAQELHDGVLGRLFGTRLNLDSLNRMNDENSVKKRNSYLAELKNIEQDIREISHDLNREKYVLINNFVAILNNLLEEQKGSFDAEVDVNIDENIHWESVSNTLKINLYRIIQESLQNINKYAQAKNIILELKIKDNNLSVSITDDGIGFTVNSKKKGIGLQNMFSRASDLNGIFDIRSKKGKGTAVIVSFPIEDRESIQTEYE